MGADRQGPCLDMVCGQGRQLPGWIMLVYVVEGALYGLTCLEMESLDGRSAKGVIHEQDTGDGCREYMDVYDGGYTKQSEDVFVSTGLTMAFLCWCVGLPPETTRRDGTMQHARRCVCVSCPVGVMAAVVVV